MQKLVGVTEVADLTGVSCHTLRRWRYEGVGPQSAKLGRRIVYREEDVLAWIEAQFAKYAGGTPAA